MTVYNGAEYINASVQSVINQTFEEFEFLIINDCSTDDSTKIIESFNDKRVVIYDNEKGNVKYFSVQLEIMVQNEWKVVIRYDCSHGFSHVDKYDNNGNQIKTNLNLGFKSALTYGDWDINENWLKYKQEFLKKGSEQ